LQEDEDFVALRNGVFRSCVRENLKEALATKSDSFLEWFQSDSAHELRDKVCALAKPCARAGGLEKHEAESSQGSAAASQSQDVGQDSGILAHATALLKAFDPRKSLDSLWSPRNGARAGSDEHLDDMEADVVEEKCPGRYALMSELEAAGLRSWALKIDEAIGQAAVAAPSGEGGRGGDGQAALERVIPKDWRKNLILLTVEHFLECLGDSLSCAGMDDDEFKARKHQEKARRKILQKMVTRGTRHHAMERYVGELPRKLMEFVQLYKELAPKLGRRTLPNKKEYFEKRAKLQALLHDGVIVDALPIWIMPTDLVSEIFPSQLGLFDLVVLEEASQSDCRAIPALLRGKKLVVVGDSKQVSPPEKRDAYCQMLSTNLGQAIPDRTKRNLLPGKSVFDLFEMVFSGRNTTVKLKEHFRSASSLTLMAP